MINKKYALILLCIGLSFQACKKDKQNPSNPNPDPVTAPEHQLQINFANTSIDINKIDSVTVTLQKAGAQASASKKLTKGTSTYYTDGFNLQNSTWKASVTVYTTKEADNQASHVYNIEKEMSQWLSVNAPTGKLSDAWSPLLMVNDAVHKVQMIVAERQDDPYFAFNAINPADWEYIYMEKGTETANERIDKNMVYETSDLFPDNKNIVNTTHFLPYTNSMKGKSWITGYFFVMMFDKNGENEITVWHKYAKRPE